MTKKVDYIIVGQGLAGTLLSYFLIQNDQQVFIIDNKHKKSSSKIAAGLINPITGRRFVKSWMIDTLLPFAKTTYNNIEETFDIKLFHQKNILRVLNNAKDENEWLSRSITNGWEAYFLDTKITDYYKNIITNAFSIGELTKSAQVDFPLLLNTFRKYFIKHDIILEEKCDYQAIDIQSDEVNYKNIEAKHLIFCEGHQIANNPFFRYLPLVPAKGEILIVKIPNYQFDKMIKHGIFILNLKDDLYWVGATFAFPNQYKDDLPSEEGKHTLIKKLQHALNVPFELIEHHASIRPTVKDRRPLLGTHSIYNCLHIFNGMGTKGASLAPYWANQMTQFLLKNIELDRAVDISRFEEYMERSEVK